MNDKLDWPTGKNLSEAWKLMGNPPKSKLSPQEYELLFQLAAFLRNSNQIERGDFVAAIKGI